MSFWAFSPNNLDGRCTLYILVNELTSKQVNKRAIRMVVVLCTLSSILYSFFITSAGCVLLTFQILWLMVRRVMPATMSIASTR